MKVLSITAKCSDMFSASLTDDKTGSTYYDGYVPKWLPNANTEHYGDYVELKIDIDTGTILNWKKPTTKDLSIFKKENE